MCLSFWFRLWNGFSRFGLSARHPHRGQLWTVATIRSAKHGAAVRGRVVETQFFGAFWRVHIELSATSTRLIADLAAGNQTEPPAPEAIVHLHWGADAVHVIEDDVPVVADAGGTA